MAQKKVDEAQLNIDGVAVTQTEANSFNLAINSTITTDGSAHATIHAFNGTMWLLDETPVAFASVMFPETASDAEVPVNISQTVTVDHLSELTAFNQALLVNETVNVRVNGSTTIRVSGIARDYPITFSKDIVFQGFNGFAGINVTDPVVGLTATKNFNATVNIPNPTVWSVEVVSIQSYPLLTILLVSDYRACYRATLPSLPSSTTPRLEIPTSQTWFSTQATTSSPSRVTLTN